MSRILTAFVPAVLVLLTGASTVFAQADHALEDNAWKTPAAAILLGGFIIAVSIKKSKREHRD